MNSVWQVDGRGKTKTIWFKFDIFNPPQHNWHSVTHRNKDFMFIYTGLSCVSLTWDMSIPYFSTAASN